MILSHFRLQPKHSNAHNTSPLVCTEYTLTRWLPALLAVLCVQWHNGDTAGYEPWNVGFQDSWGGGQPTAAGNILMW